MKSISLSVIFILLMSIMGVAVNGMKVPIEEANAQPADEVQLSFEYTFNHDYLECTACMIMEPATKTVSYVATSTMKPVTGGYDGNGSGLYTSSLVVNCEEGYQFTRTDTGVVDMTVKYRYSIDSGVGTGDRTGTNSSYGVVYVEFHSDSLHVVESHSGCGDVVYGGPSGGVIGDSNYDWYGGVVGTSCSFYELSFEDGQTYTSTNPTNQGWPDAKCFVRLGPVPDEFRIFGKVSSTVEGVRGLNSVPISNSRVAIAKIEEPMINKLSVSKPPFFEKTATSDDQDAKYEFNFTDPGKPPRILVVSLLWYEGKPEFAVTNGKNVSGNSIPVYQAHCVDEDPATECLKWKRTADGSYEAEVDFRYGSQQKLLDIITFMELEDWEGTGGDARIQMNSGYIYYNSYRAMKYLENLGLGIQLRPVMIKSHHIDNECPIGGDDAWYNPFSPIPTFGDLGILLDKVVATGGGAYICDITSHTSNPDAPLNREWHELGHYMLFEMHAPSFPASSTRGIPHNGYRNNSTNDSYIEGMASFFAMLTNEYYGHPNPDLYRVGTGVIDVELNYKAWGLRGNDEEFALAGVLWDFHDPGREVGVGFMLNGALIQTSKVYPSPTDTVSLDAKTILQVLERSKAKTAVDIYNAFVGLRISQVDLDMILVDHGFFADVEDRNYIHDSAAETIPETGSKTGPVRLVRHSPVPTIPGAYIASNSDAIFNVTISYSEPFEYSDYSYILEMKGGEPAYFEMPPEYYPSTAFITPISNEGKPLPGRLVIDSDEYWTYVNSNPPADGVFKSISVEGGSVSDTITAVEYIQNVRNLLSRVSTEYKAGNASGAEELATMAYIDNFEHVETELDQRNATELKEQIEQMLRVELVGLIRDRADSESVDAKIAAINGKFDEAIVIVPEFPFAALGAVAAVIGVVSILGRTKLFKR